MSPALAGGAFALRTRSASASAKVDCIEARPDIVLAPVICRHIDSQPRFGDAGRGAISQQRVEKRLEEEPRTHHRRNRIARQPQDTLFAFTAEHQGLSRPHGNLPELDGDP
jgi:hypothetical protein